MKHNRTHNFRTPTPGHRRRGVLLLVVLSLLVLFALIGITFVLVASQHLDKTRMALRDEQYGDDPRQLCDAVLAQCIRDTTELHSVLRGHSLLADMYGNDGARGTVDIGSPSIAGGQFIDLQASNVTAMFWYPDPINPPPATLPIVTDAQIQTPGFYNGCVLTMVDGPAAGKSTRIVGWGYNLPNPGDYTIRVMAFEGVSGSLTDSNFIINGRPFNGTGFGFNPDANPASAATLLDARQEITHPGGTKVEVPYALLPNPVFADPSRLPDTAMFPQPKWQPDPVQPLGTYPLFGGIGGADEEYDAHDAQNMLLAHIPLDPGGAVTGAIIPSLHRPGTWLYVNGLGNSGPAKRLVERQVLMRPSKSDHPFFQGPKTLDQTAGPFDVDNDGDGIRESVWVDAGLGVRTAPDGRTYKPMVAILCLDLDGRLNVNAHGSVAQVPGFTPPTTIPATSFAGNAVPTVAAGFGYGTAEVNLLQAVFNGDSNRYQQFLAARYSEPDATLTSTDYLLPNAPYPGATNTEDGLSAIKQFEFPMPGAPALSAYGAPPDLWGRGFVALDVRGTPLTPNMGDPNDALDDPYELNLSRKAIRSARSSLTPSTSTTPADSPFSAAELERVLRMYDVDARELPDRLRGLVDGAGGPALAILRGMVTSDSYDLPVPAIVPTRDMRVAARANNLPEIGQSISDLLRIRMAAAPYTGALPFEQEAVRMLPPELVAGLRMDINRPFGNGRDDNGNGIVDEPAEQPEANFWDPSRFPAGPPDFGTAQPTITNGIDVNNDTFVDNADKPFARQLFARHLYVLMMLLKDEATEIDFNRNGVSEPGETARGIAQWAINVVDFRDRDSIMTPFEYTRDPFANGWTADGDLSATDFAREEVVWGCERPELLITETLAFHDRRTEDMNTESPAPPAMQAGFTNDTDPMKKDDDFDQRLIPRGSLFVELYNPWVTRRFTTNGLPSAVEESGEFYTINTATNDATGVNLNGLAPNNSPIWRMLIVKGTALNSLNQPKDPDDPIPAERPNPLLDVERSIYFVAPPAFTDHGQPYHCSIAPTPLLPGRYAVIGSAGLTDGTDYITTIGRHTFGGGAGSGSDTTQDGINANTPNTRQIKLTPSANGSLADPVQFVNNVPPLEPSFAAGDIRAPIAVVIDTPRSVSVSEPTGGYPAGTGMSGPMGAEEPIYSTAFDIPLDSQPLVQPDAATVAILAANGLAPNYRVIHLQRLADPTAPYDQFANPYRTIDTMPINLTTFNGVTSDTEPGAGNPLDRIASLQRGDNGPSNSNNLWRREIIDPMKGPPPAVPAVGLPAHNLNFALRHSLGHLNIEFGSKATGDMYVAGDPQVTTLAEYAGAPKRPFPWLTWNNRPFVGPMELLLVPKSRSSQLLFDYNPLSAPNPYDSTTATIPAGTPGAGHLLNFFRLPPAGDPPTAPAPTFFDYLQVPSRFVSTETVLAPGNLEFGLPNETELFSFFYPPFNKVSNYRDPGRVNINTIPGDAFAGGNSSIWNAILNVAGGAPAVPNWTAISQSRQGSTQLDPGRRSTFVANPFRSAVGASLGLPGTPDQPGVGGAGGQSAEAAIPARDAVDVTLMRPLAARTDAPATDQPLFDSPSSQPYNDTNRNPFFRFQNMQRVSNLLTTRSNVYAIWITIGFFEVDPIGSVTPDRLDIYPDGYVLRQEVGADTGEVKRHRAFYIFDRSIPVGFEPGQDHNFEDGLLLRRFIE